MGVGLLNGVKLAGNAISIYWGLGIFLFAIKYMGDGLTKSSRG